MIDQELSEIERYLLRFHDRNPGCTSTNRAASTTQDGRTGYEILADIVPPGRSLSVLDLACGDGFLLELLHQRNSGKLALFGIDLCSSELALARARFGSKADLQVGRVQSLPYASQSMDVVLCHMALMLFDSIEQVLAEVKRVLVPGGVFAAVVSGTPVDCPASVIFRNLLKTYLAKASSQHFLGRFGDRRLKDPTTALELLKDYFDQTSVEAEIVTGMKTVNDAVRNYLTHYGPDLLSPEDQVELAQRLQVEFKALAGDENGLMACQSGVWILRGQA